MRSVTRWVLAAVLAVAAAGAAVAQPPGGGGRGMGMGGFGGVNVYNQVASSKLLAEELKLTDEQKGKLKEALDPIAKQQRELFGRGGRQGGERPSEEALKEMNEKREKLAAEAKKAVEGVLTPEQGKRLSQIGHQVQGVRAFAAKDVQEALKLSDEQKDKVKGILEEHGKASRELFGARPEGGDRPSREEMAKRMAEGMKKQEALAKETMEKVSGVLKDEQKETWKGMVGASFDVAKLQQEAMQSMMRRRDD